MGILKNGKVSSILLSVMMMVILMCCSSQVQAATEEGYTYSGTRVGGVTTVTIDKATINEMGVLNEATPTSTIIADNITATVAGKSLMATTTTSSGGAAGGGGTSSDGGSGATFVYAKSVQTMEDTKVTSIDDFIFVENAANTLQPGDVIKFTVPNGFEWVGTLPLVISKWGFMGKLTGTPSISSDGRTLLITCSGTASSITGAFFVGNAKLQVTDDSVAQYGDVVMHVSGDDVTEQDVTIANYQTAYTYTITDGKATVTKYTGAGGDVSIPSTLGGYPVTCIGTGAFRGCSSLTSTSLPNSVTSIGDEAFQDCRNLTSVTLSESVSSIGDSAFDCCLSLTSVSLPNSITSIGSRAFCFTGLTDVSIPESITSIKWETFKFCSSLTNVVIPNSVTSISDEAFANCDALTSITIPEGVTSIGKGAFGFCHALTAITVADNNQNYVSANGMLFNKVSTVLIAYPAGLTGINLPTGTTEISDSAFEGCDKLTSIEIPKGVINIGDDAFYGCSGLASISIPESVTGIGSNAFMGCSALTSIYIPKNVTSISGNAFGLCRRLTTITVSDDNQNYASVDGVLHNKAKTVLLACPGGLTGVYIATSVTCIDDYAFFECTGLTSIIIPEGVISIGRGAFSYCSGLTGITIPQGVTTISDSAFYGCTNLTSITFKSPTTTIIDPYGYSIPTTTKIIGYDPSTAKDYATKYGMTFEVLSAQSVDECFIATAAFGSKFTWPVALLRHFRDEYLLTNGPGRVFVTFYYHNSPPIAHYIAGNDGLRGLVRVLLAPFIAVVYLIFNPALGLALVLICLGLLIVRKKWYSRFIL